MEYEKSISNYFNKYGDSDELRYLNPRRTEHFAIIPETDNEKMNEVAKSFGIQFEKKNEEDYKRSLITFGINTNKSLEFRKSYFKSDEYFSLLLIRNSYELRPFQISELLYSANPDTMLSVSARTLNENDFQNFRRHLSTILATTKIWHGKGKSIGETKQNETELAKKYYAMDKDNFILVAVGVLIRGSDPIELRNNVRNIMNLLKTMGLELQITNRKEEICNFLSGRGLNYKYLIPRNKIIPLIPFLSSSPPNNGLPIGFDSINGRPVFLDLFLGSSNNILILGETGSGKSFFARLLLLRLINLGKIESAYILDPLNDFSNIRNSNIILDHRSPEEVDMPGIKSFIISPGGNKVIIIDEAHKFFNNTDAREAVLDMVRTSRHFSCSVVLITQDISDFLIKPYDSIFNNSQYICIFRNKMWEQVQKIGINLSDYGYDPKNPLLGGKNLNFSEMFLYTNGTLRKVKIMNTEYDQFTLE
ncbi:helicase HerA domain-containing protein [Cuniculiplasma sp. SKW4]|uniref:helicase HerA domain-containing protein n=1 Tax=Cuniculiplasma sp. SKW4 TaxID=3400171 RepID=UPI003FD14A5D